MAKIKIKQVEVTSDIDMQTTHKIVNLADPQNAQDAATKAYVDANIQGLDPKHSCKAATTGIITLFGEQTIDTIPVTAGMRVLVKNQGATSPSLDKNNGIYIVSTSGWTRSTDANSWDELISAFTFIEEGAVNKDTGWVCTANTGGTLGVTAVEWTQFSGVGSYSADGDGIYLDGSVFKLELDGDSLSKSASGLKGSVQYKQEAVAVTPTASPSIAHDTGLTITYTPTGDCDIVVSVNGVETPVSYGATTSAFYYTSPADAVRAKAAIVAGDKLWFNPVAAGYSLEITDMVSQVYSKIN